ncbi:FAD-dependent monooxygenase [Thalassobaculum sp.]|uniref:FAD-dependent monooxygenase n=1 Tax=Thalassobaculum sp. TaxID=2022740 RepID=UPI003B5AEBC8
MQVDAVIVGDGPTGRLAYRVLSGLGLDTVIVAPANTHGADPRTTALLPSSVEGLDGLGIDVRPKATPLPTMIIESLGPFGTTAERFSAAEVGAEYLALNLPIGDLVGLMPAENRVEDKVVALRHGAGDVTAITEGGAEITARLAVAADGVKSPTREAARIRLWRQPLGLSALCAPVELDTPHEGLCIERYDDTGSITVIPVGSRAGSLISIAPSADVDRLLAAGLPAIEASAARRQPAYGAIRLTASPVVFPVSLGWAPTPARRRVVAVGEAAHTVPPIGAQGWNLAVRDLLALQEVLAGAVRAGGDIGGNAVLARYIRRRRFELPGRLAAVGMLAGVATDTSLRGRLARQVGLGVLSRVPPIKHGLMRSGLA